MWSGSPRALLGKVALVTAATDGIGLAVAEALGVAGAQVLISSRRESNVERAVTHLRGRGLQVSGVTCHVGRAEDRERMVQAVRESWGHLGYTWAHLGTPGIHLRHTWGHLGTPGYTWAHLGYTWDTPGHTWDTPGIHLGTPGIHLGYTWAHLGYTWDTPGHTWDTPGIHLGTPGIHLGYTWAHLGVSGMDF
uniref:Uncharacterized protein n=1 Tax=Ficedula albicollis TaxID=59894 RepID=A0A803VT02_FICAL